MPWALKIIIIITSLNTTQMIGDKSPVYCHDSNLSDLSKQATASTFCQQQQQQHQLLQQRRGNAARDLIQVSAEGLDLDHATRLQWVNTLANNWLRAAVGLVEQRFVLGSWANTHWGHSETYLLLPLNVMVIHKQTRRQVYHCSVFRFRVYLWRPLSNLTTTIMIIYSPPNSTPSTLVIMLNLVAISLIVWMAKKLGSCARPLAWSSIDHCKSSPPHDGLLCLIW